jgi:hypothetical protein
LRETHLFAGNPPLEINWTIRQQWCEHLPNTEYLAALQQTISKRSPNNQNNFITENFHKQTLPVVNVYVHKLIHEFEVSSYQYIYFPSKFLYVVTSHFSRLFHWNILKKKSNFHYHWT